MLTTLFMIAALGQSQPIPQGPPVIKPIPQGPPVIMSITIEAPSPDWGWHWIEFEGGVIPVWGWHPDPHTVRWSPSLPVNAAIVAHSRTRY